MRRFSADIIYTLEGEPIPNGIVVTDDFGKILSISDEKAIFDRSIERYQGIIVPGFINSHCHLELSHLRGKIQKKTGLIDFIKQVITKRAAPEAEIIVGMEEADAFMWENGIVAVGDISNQVISAELKKKSKIRYHTFVEMLGLDATKADEIIKAGDLLKNRFETPASLTVHAPYSISKELVKKLAIYAKNQQNLVSMHNQECAAEEPLYKTRSGPFLQFYKDLNICADTFRSKYLGPLQALLPFMPNNQHILLVHNTYINLKDVFATERFGRNVFWCFCPNANLYIEDRLPPFNFFKYTEFPITIGTDSLASNDSLSILDEMYVIQKNIPNLSLNELLKWACLNGARFLGYDAELGSIAVGKTPGLNLLSDLDNGRIGENTKVKKLI